jgi:hypothetical protein
MGQAAGEVVLLETMEAATHAPPEFARVGVNPNKVHLATRSRKGYWRMSQNELVRIALNNRWLEEQGVPDMRAVWMILHYGPDARV